MKHDIIDRLFLGSIITVAALCIGLIVYAMTQPGCSDRGGKLTVVGGHYVTNMVGKVPVTTWMPIYTCTGAHK